VNGELNIMTEQAFHHSFQHVERVWVDGRYVGFVRWRSDPLWKQGVTEAHVTGPLTVRDRAAAIDVIVEHARRNPRFEMTWDLFPGREIRAEPYCP